MDWIIGIGMMALGIAVVVLLWRNYCLRKEAAQFAGKVEQALDAIVTGKEWKRQGELTDSLWDRIETQLAKAEHVFQRKQEESLREKETVKGLISDISHQTRTPLANMKLYVELLEEETLSGEGTGFLAKLCEQTVDKVIEAECAALGNMTDEESENMTALMKLYSVLLKSQTAKI